ncbi:MAG: ketopantoate reductase family protein [Thermoplasmatota archaeon]
MRVDVVGAGAIGGSLAAMLTRAGEDVTIVVKESALELYASGIQVRRLAQSPPESFSARPAVRTRTRADADMVLLCVKTQDVRDACGRITEGPGLVIVLANGIAADALAAAQLPGRRVIAGVLFVEATSIELPAIDILGRFEIALPSNAPAEADMLGGAVMLDRRADFEGVRWTKLMGNLFNGLTAATGQPLQKAISGAGAPLAIHLLREGFRVADEAGVTLVRTPLFDPGPIRWLLRLPDGIGAILLQQRIARSFPTHPIYGSTLQSLRRGRPTEVEWLNGVIVREGRRLGVPTPANEAVVEAVRRAEKGGGAAAARDLLRTAKAHAKKR